MGFDKQMLNQLLKEDDEMLWQNIVGIAAKSGIRLSQKTPPREEMQKLRDLLADADRISPFQAQKILRNMGKNGESDNGR